MSTCRLGLAGAIAILAILALVLIPPAVLAKKPPKPPPDPEPDPEIAYVMSKKKGKAYVYELCVMNADGTNQTKVTDLTFAVAEPDWSPDGNRLVYQDSGGLYVVNLDGTNKIRVLDWAPSYYGVAWCPVPIDGEDAIVFSWCDASTSGAEADLYLLILDGSNPVQLTDTPALSELRPDWSPSGDRIACEIFDQDDPGRWGLYDMSAETFDVIELKGDLAGVLVLNPAWAKADEDLIAWSVVHRDGPSYQCDIWVLDLADQENPVRLTETGSTNEQFPSFSPNDSRIVFTAMPVSGPSTRSIEVMDADGSDRTVLIDSQAERAAWKR
jgi:Tol biopolymer transport system component